MLKLFIVLIIATAASAQGWPNGPYDLAPHGHSAQNSNSNMNVNSNMAPPMQPMPPPMQLIGGTRSIPVGDGQGGYWRGGSLGSYPPSGPGSYGPVFGGGPGSGIGGGVGSIMGGGPGDGLGGGIGYPGSIAGGFPVPPYPQFTRCY